MAATISGALKLHIESLGLGLVAYRDTAPTDAPDRYCVITEGIAIVPALLGDNGEDDAVVETVQVDLYEPWRNPDDAREMAENYETQRALEQGLRAFQPTDLPMRVHGVRGVSRTRQLQTADNLVRNIYTVEVRRDQ